MVIYKISNDFNDKVYIGQTTKTLRERMLKHFRGRKTYIDRTISKYGKEHFKVDELCSCENIDELNELEVFIIELVNSQKPYGYNITSGGKNQHNFKHTEETKNLMKLKKVGYIPWNKGKKMSDEARKNMSIAQYNSNYVRVGFTPNEETKKKISETLKGNIPWNKDKNDIYSKETKIKMSKSHSKKLECPYCGFITNVSNCKRYHFENCKNKII